MSGAIGAQYNFWQLKAQQLHSSAVLQVEDKSSFSVNRPIEAFNRGTFKPDQAQHRSRAKFARIGRAVEQTSLNATMAQRLPPPW